MSPRTVPFALLVLTLAAGCGEEFSPGEARFGVDLLVDKAVAADLSAFQLAVLPNGKERNCTEIQKQCLSLQVKANELLILRDGQGTQGRVLRFPVNLTGSGVTSQDVAIEVPVGRDYALVIEGLSQDNPPRLLGSSCNYLPEVNASRNDPILAAPMTLLSVDCNPTIGG
ncbi:hypothetical protein [Hyalangium sp.]|uniref:hypothetical protein n=1 Tax=Hyalangium sp. TaxID=2028555 RepID=UPI002D31F795|nr:hypothetical protein [Hyalangium sp.]HYH99463.1 hypothetical protein [Hyalangium sp.]